MFRIEREAQPREIDANPRTYSNQSNLITAESRSFLQFQPWYFNTLASRFLIHITKLTRARTKIPTRSDSTYPPNESATLGTCSISSQLRHQLHRSRKLHKVSLYSVLMDFVRRLPRVSRRSGEAYNYIRLSGRIHNTVLQQMGQTQRVTWVVRSRNRRCATAPLTLKHLEWSGQGKHPDQQHSIVLLHETSLGNRRG